MQRKVGELVGVREKRRQGVTDVELFKGCETANGRRQQENIIVGDLEIREK